MNNWNDAYKSTPKCYAKPDGSSFEAISLTEGTKTFLPRNPQSEYKIDGKVIETGIVKGFDKEIDNMKPSGYIVSIRNYAIRPAEKNVVCMVVFMLRPI